MNKIWSTRRLMVQERHGVTFFLESITTASSAVLVVGDDPRGFFYRESKIRNPRKVWSKLYTLNRRHTKVLQAQRVSLSRTSLTKSNPWTAGSAG